MNQHISTTPVRTIVSSINHERHELLHHPGTTGRTSAVDSIYARQLGSIFAQLSSAELHFSTACSELCRLDRLGTRQDADGCCITVHGQHCRATGLIIRRATGLIPSCYRLCQLCQKWDKMGWFFKLATLRAAIDQPVSNNHAVNSLLSYCHMLETVSSESMTRYAKEDLRSSAGRVKALLEVTVTRLVHVGPILIRWKGNEKHTWYSQQHSDQGAHAAASCLHLPQEAKPNDNGDDPWKASNNGKGHCVAQFHIGLKPRNHPNGPNQTRQNGREDELAWQCWQWVDHITDITGFRFLAICDVMYPLFLVVSDCMIVGYNILDLQLTTCYIYICIYIYYTYLYASISAIVWYLYRKS